MLGGLLKNNNPHTIAYQIEYDPALSLHRQHTHVLFTSANQLICRLGLEFCQPIHILLAASVLANCLFNCLFLMTLFRYHANRNVAVFNMAIFYTDH